MHAVFIVVLVQVVPCSVVVVVKGCCDAFQQFGGVGQTVAVPVVVHPVDHAVVVVVKGGLFFTPKATGNGFLINVQPTVVVVVGIFAIGDAVVVVVNVVKAGTAETL